MTAPSPSPEVAIRAPRLAPRRLSRKALMTGALLIGGIVAFALVSGLSAAHPRRTPASAGEQRTASGPPDIIANAAADYASNDLVEAPTEIAAPVAELPQPADAFWRGAPRAEASSSSAAPSTSERTPVEDALASPILFPGHRSAGEAAQEAGLAPEGRRGSFMARQQGRDGMRLEERLTPPGSRFGIVAGSTISAALMTELNSDLPGRVLAQVTAPVYDSLTGGTLLVPQGARLIGTYDSANAYGDRRLLLVWNRLVFPNGWSIALRGMEGVDAAGAAGLSDRTDNHLGRLATAAGLSGLLSVVANDAEDKHSGRLAQSVGDAAAQEAARTGGRIVDRELAVRPTLRVRAGAAVRVLVTRDIELRPYRQ